MIQIKRTYDAPARGDGRRLLVERLWPRGMKKESLIADAWLKDVAPSTRLRQWFGHDVKRWEEFQQRYRRELDSNPGAWLPIFEESEHGTVTLLYSAHDTDHNGALVLRDYLIERRAEASAARVQRPRRRRSRVAVTRRRSRAAVARHGSKKRRTHGGGIR